MYALGETKYTRPFCTATYNFLGFLLYFLKQKNNKLFNKYYWNNRTYIKE